MNLRQTLVIAALLSLAGLTSWEMYWRSQGKIPDLDDDKNLWADQRARVNYLTKEDVVLLGSSRVLFDIQLNEWEKATGKRPVQLATAGGMPLPMFRDIVENTDFNGTLVVGVTPGIFFFNTDPKSFCWNRSKYRIDYFHKRTYAQRLNHFLSVPLQKNLTLVSVSEERWADDIDLRSLIRNIKIGNRVEEYPPFYSFQYIDEDRNVRMSERCVRDTAFANTIKRVWMTDAGSPPPQKEETISYFLQDAKKFMDRGGNLILLRCPSSGFYYDEETKNQPRAAFWDELVKRTGAKGYYYEDYDQLKYFECPEWSHLSADDADIFTRELLKIMIKDGSVAGKG
jgi:hypothetical protein